MHNKAHAASPLTWQAQESDTKWSARRRCIREKRQWRDGTMTCAGRFWPEAREPGQGTNDANSSKGNRGQKAGGSGQHGYVELRVAGQARRCVPTIECLQNRSEQCHKKQHHQSAPEKGSDHGEILQQAEGFAGGGLGFVLSHFFGDETAERMGHGGGCLVERVGLGFVRSRVSESRPGVPQSVVG